MSGRGSCKVDDVVEAFELDAPAGTDETLDEHLLVRWQGRGDREPMGYRTLTDWFNKRLLKRVYDEHSRTTIGARLDSEYAVLTGDDELTRRELVEDLRSDGIDADRLLDGLVSWSTMRHHLTGCLGAEKPSPTETSDWERESLDAIRESTRARLAKVVRSLESKGRVTGAGGSELHVDLQLACPQCPTRVPVERALEQGYVCERHPSEPESLISR